MSTPTPTPFSTGSDPSWDDPWDDGQWPDTRGATTRRVSTPKEFDPVEAWGSTAEWRALKVPPPRESPPTTPTRTGPPGPAKYKAKDPQSSESYQGNSSAASSDFGRYADAIKGITLTPPSPPATSSDVSSAIGAISGAATSAIGTISSEAASTVGSIHAFQPPSS